MTRLKIPTMCVIVHTALLLLTAFAIFLSRNSGNPDASIGFLMACLTFYVIDFPIGLLFEICRPHFPGTGSRVLLGILLYGVLGNLMWFLVGTAICVWRGGVGNRVLRTAQPPNIGQPQSPPSADRPGADGKVSS
jgi:hypothetical protein